MKRLIAGVAVATAVLLPTALQAGEPKKVKLPRACTQALGAAATAFESFDVIFGTPGDAEDLGVLGEYFDSANAGTPSDTALTEINEELNAGQDAEIDFLDLLETCGEKARL
jgi:hypothetical protein